MKSATFSRAMEVLAMAAIGEGLISLTSPARHLQLWAGGPQWWRECMERLARRPAAVRSLALAELGLGLYLARRSLNRRLHMR
jgi:hypothetical protein